jgi:two-component system, chemotaxis family, chemotaxis protein CheY
MALNILIVDDSETVRAIIAKTLKMAQVPVGELYNAANGKEALEVLGENWVDLVFSDINMPVMGGVEMIEQMCADNLMKTIPVVVVSTEGSTTRMEELKAKGVRAYIRKPFTPELVRNVVTDIMGGLDDGES